eukprot:5226415-Alexandrium_andersonii.AAC.1
MNDIAGNAFQCDCVAMVVLAALVFFATSEGSVMDALDSALFGDGGDGISQLSPSQASAASASAAAAAAGENSEH